MSIIYKIKKHYLLISLVICIIFVISFFIKPVALTIFEDKETTKKIQELFDVRNNAILDKDTDILEKFYDKSVKYGSWAYAHELKKMTYLHRWSDKQGIKFSDINSKVMVRWIKNKGDKTTINLTVSTEYKYYYEDNTQKTNDFRIGTYHSIDVKEVDEKLVIIREWYTDPFADSMQLDQNKTDKIKDYITSQNYRDMSNLLDRRKNAIEYADKYCGAAGEDTYSYNKKYKNYNSLGGDCANFASQILFEGGKFRKNYTWNYVKDGSKSWVNAQAFKNYMIYSGRASTIAHGTYDNVYKAAYKLLPGDFVAYEKKGKVIHISVVTGTDSKGYALVNSHNTDRYRVPWDLGWSNKGIKFWLIHVHF